MIRAFSWLDRFLDTINRTLVFHDNESSYHKNFLKNAITELKRDNSNYFDVLTGAYDSVKSFHETLKANNIVLPTKEEGMFGAI